MLQKCVFHIICGYSEVFIEKRLEFKLMTGINGMRQIVDLYRIENEIQQAKARGNIKKALQLYDIVIEMKSSLPNRLGLVKTIAEKGFLLENCQFYNDALSEYQTAFKIADHSTKSPMLQTISERIFMLSPK